jgi:hypothetical protein
MCLAHSIFILAYTACAIMGCFSGLCVTPLSRTLKGISGTVQYDCFCQFILQMTKAGF